MDEDEIVVFLLHATFHLQFRNRHNSLLNNGKTRFISYNRKLYGERFQIMERITYF